MKVKTLIKMLQQCNPDDDVMFFQDDEVSDVSHMEQSVTDETVYLYEFEPNFKEQEEDRNIEIIVHFVEYCEESQFVVKQQGGVNMAQTKLGGQKAAATKIGIPVEQYLQKVNSGSKWCLVCRNFKSRDFFNSDLGKIDGKTYNCKSCSRAKDRQRYTPVPLDRQKPRGFAVHPPRDGDKQQARNQVNREVAKGKLPHARTVPCTDCGHIGSDRQHEYDHYLGYAAINHLVVECVCVPCHNKREQRRRKQEE